MHFGFEETFPTHVAFQHTCFHCFSKLETVATTAVNMIDCLQRLFNECLNQKASHFASDQSGKKVQLCKELVTFLTNTPNVFDEPWSTSLSWTRPLFRGLFDIIQSKTRYESSAIEMTSIPVRVFNDFKWATDSDQISSKFVGLVIRLSCLELSMFLDETKNEMNHLVGACLIIIEHAILTLFNEDMVDNLEPTMNPDEICTIIDMARETVIKIMDFMIDSRDENLANTTESSEEIQALSLGFIRIISLLLTEDDITPPERVAKLVSVFPAAISTRS